MILQGASSYYKLLFDILIDILFNIEARFHNQVTIRLSTRVFDHFAACTSFELETCSD